MHRFIEYVVVILMIASYIPYIKGIWKGVIMPQISTWMCWAMLDWLLWVAMLQKGAVNGSVTAATLGATTITIVTLFKGKTGWSQIDTVSCLGALVGAILWFCTDALWAIVSFLSGIIIATIPTIQKIWIDPDKERKALLSWALRATGCLISLLNVREWTISNVLQPIVFSCGMITITILLLRKGRKI